MPDADHEQPSIKVNLGSIYAQVQDTNIKVTKLEQAVSDLVAVNKRLDDHSNNLEKNSERLRKVEAQVASQWVIVSIVVVVIGAAVVRALVTI
jgi:uncharacterized protein YukE